MKYQRLFKLYRIKFWFIKSPKEMVLEIRLAKTDGIIFSRKITEQLLMNCEINKPNELSLYEFLQEGMLQEAYNKIKRKAARDFIKSLPRKERKLIMKYL